MTVVNWDLNLAFGGLGAGGFPGGVGGGFPGGSIPEGGGPGGGFPGGSLPEGFPEGGGFPGGSIPEGGGFPGGSLPEGFPEGGGFPGGSIPEGMPEGGGLPGRSNPLVERFMADETFNALYETKVAELTETLYSSGAADQILDQWVATLTEQATDLVNAETITAEAADIAALFTAPESPEPATDDASTTTPATTVA
jgi:spore coat protein CotH